MTKKRRLKTPVKVIASLLVLGMLGAGIYKAADHLKPGKAENELEMPDETEHALPIVLDEMREPESEENTMHEEQSEVNSGETDSSVQEETASDETQMPSAEETAEISDDQTIESGSEEQPGTETPPEPEETDTIILPFDPAD